jgi:hypothetical protein
MAVPFTRTLHSVSTDLTQLSKRILSQAFRYVLKNQRLVCLDFRNSLHKNQALLQSSLHRQSSLSHKEGT